MLLHTHMGVKVTIYTHHVMQENGREWFKELAQECLTIGQGLLASGWGQPPMRLGAMRVMHKFDKRQGIPCCYEKCK